MATLCFRGLAPRAQLHKLRPHDPERPQPLVRVGAWRRREDEKYLVGVRLDQGLTVEVETAHHRVDQTFFIGEAQSHLATRPDLEKFSTLCAESVEDFCGEGAWTITSDILSKKRNRYPSHVVVVLAEVEETSVGIGEPAIDRASG